VFFHSLLKVICATCVIFTICAVEDVHVAFHLLLFYFLLLVPELVEGEEVPTLSAAPSLREVGGGERASFYTLRQAQGP
jgi:hypothetical protein